MKKITLSLAVLALIAAFSFSSCKQEAPVVEEVVEEPVGVSGMFEMDPSASTITWLGKKVTGEHTGNISMSAGKFQMENGAITDAKVIIDMNSITVTDLEDAEMNAKLLGHLQSEDFFNTAAFPEASFYSTSVNGNTLTGDLVIKGISNPADLSYTLTEVDGKQVVTGSLEVDRTLYDIKYGSGKFFQDLGDKTINDTFTLTFEIATK